MIGVMGGRGGGGEVVGGNGEEGQVEVVVWRAGLIGSGSGGKARGESRGGGMSSSAWRGEGRGGVVGWRAGPAGSGSGGKSRRESRGGGVSSSAWGPFVVMPLSVSTEEDVNFLLYLVLPHWTALSKAAWLNGGVFSSSTAITVS